MRKRRDVTFYRLHFTPKAAAAAAEAEAGVERRVGHRELFKESWGYRGGGGYTAASVVDSGDLLLHATDATPR